VKHVAFIPAILLFLFVPITSFAISDDEVRAMIIKDSLNSYPGPCPCPYNIMRNGAPCGYRSAYSKPGGYEPLCYKSDISSAMVETYRKKYKIN
jgi:hypothetical protein